MGASLISYAKRRERGKGGGEGGGKEGRERERKDDIRTGKRGNSRDTRSSLLNLLSARAHGLESRRDRHTDVLLPRGILVPAGTVRRHARECTLPGDVSTADWEIPIGSAGYESDEESSRVSEVTERP